VKWSSGSPSIFVVCVVADLFGASSTYMNFKNLNPSLRLRATRCQIIAFQQNVPKLCASLQNLARMGTQ
jgi:hypothetical protein